MSIKYLKVAVIIMLFAGGSSCSHQLKKEIDLSSAKAGAAGELI
jgi:hypothetical protein